MRILDMEVNNMGNTDLKKWVLENNIEERTLNGFWKAFDNYILDCPDEATEYYGILDKSKIEVYLERVYPVSKWNETTSNYIVAEMLIKYRDKLMGRYELKFKTTGETFDDCLINGALPH